MNDTLPLGRLAGVRVGVHWSVLAIASLLTVGLAESQFPDGAPGYSPAAYWVAGAVTAVLFLASILAHEVSHAVVARREGVAVEGITLWLFGGVARLQGEAATPWGDIRIAGAGPIVSIAVGAVALPLAAILDRSGASPLAVEMCAWLGAINLVLAAFNLVPAAPLDGGRLLRGVLWAWKGDRSWAAYAATRAGRVFALMLVALGVLELFGGMGFSGVWMMLIGWFLLKAAEAEGESVVLHDLLAGVRIVDVMTSAPVTGPGWFTVAAFIDEVVLTHRCSAFPVLSFDGEVVGLVTLGQLRDVPADRRSTTRVADVAQPLADVPTATTDELLVDVLQRATPSSGGGRILVVDGAGHVVGIVSPSDVSRLVERISLRRASAGGPALGSHR